MNSTKVPFLHCAFTGSTHAPYDHPKSKKPRFKREEADYMNSMVYADKCLGDFIANCKTKPWFKNTIFVFASDHGHPAPGLSNPNFNVFFRIPFLIWGEELKDTYRGK